MKKIFSIARDINFKNILLVIGLSICLSGLGICISSNYMFSTLLLYVKQPMVLLLNTIPVTLLMLCVYFITSRVWLSYFVSGAFFMLVQTVNYFKIALRYEPFVPADILLGNESTNVIKLSELPMSEKWIFTILIFVVGGIILPFVIKTKPTKILYKLVGVTLCVVLALVMYKTAYSSEARYNKYSVKGSVYSSVDIVRSKGFVYSFLVKINSLKLSEPEGYTEEHAKAVLDSYKKEADTNTKKPHVIAIMSEAFFDFDRIPGIEFEPSNNPLENYNKIIKDAYHGGVVTKVFGGGTASTECEFLTGTCLSIANWTADTYSAYIRKDTYSLARVFSSNGYKTTAFHPGHEWFYNRFNVYDYFGFDNRFFATSVTERNTPTYTSYISDMDTYKFLLKDFENHVKNDSVNPYFNFTVTIENHGPYSGDPIGYPEIIKHNGAVAEEQHYLVNNYLGGLRQNDQALGYLVEQLEKSDQPVVLMYFGDHLPFLGSDFIGYKAMNYSMGASGNLEAFLNTYQTPYFIWSNDSAKKLLEQNGKTLPVGEAPRISSNYLATVLLDYIGIDNSAYFNFLEDMEKKLPVITNRFYKTENGDFIETVNDEQQKLLNQYRDLQYYMLFQNNVNN